MLKIEKIQAKKKWQRKKFLLKQHNKKYWVIFGTDILEQDLPFLSLTSVEG